MYRNKSIPLELLMPLFERIMDLDLIEIHSLQFGADAERQMLLGVTVLMFMNGTIVLKTFLTLLQFCSNLIWL